MGWSNLFVSWESLAWDVCIAAEDWGPFLLSFAFRLLLVDIQQTNTMFCVTKKRIENSGFAEIDDFFSFCCSTLWSVSEDSHVSTVCIDVCSKCNALHQPCSKRGNCFSPCPGRHVGQTWVSDVGAGVFWEGPTRWRWTAQTSPAPPITGRSPFKWEQKPFTVGSRDPLWACCLFLFTNWVLTLTYWVNIWRCWEEMSRGCVLALTHLVGEFQNALKPHWMFYFRCFDTRALAPVFTFFGLL